MTQEILGQINLAIYIKTSVSNNLIWIKTVSPGTYLLEIKDQKTPQIIVERIIIER